MPKHPDLSTLSVQAVLCRPCAFLIPMYQRNYAWEEGEIKQLIEDVFDYSTQHSGRKPYYLGSLVVHARPDGQLELIDGQQRFTTLTLLALYLKHQATLLGPNHKQMDWYKCVNLTFESRPKSQSTLAALQANVQLHDIPQAQAASGLITGYRLIGKALSEITQDHAKFKRFCAYLFSNVLLALVEVPEDTDLNHYFEAMNNRGEQLEKHEIVKARLLDALNGIANAKQRTLSQHALDTVWEACANMNRYVQYGFSTEARKALFGHNWDDFTCQSHAELCLALDQEPSTNTPRMSMHAMLSTPAPSPARRSDDTDGESERFHSPINFSGFLLHVLRVFSGQDVPLDDKQLVDQFDKLILSEAPPKQRAQRVEAFVWALLKCKYLLDQFVIKREFANGKEQWRLQRLKRYEGSRTGYVNTFEPQRSTRDDPTHQLTQLLSAFHVSTPTTNYKHWLSACLHYLFHQNGSIQPSAYLNYLENLGRAFVFQRFVNKAPLDYYPIIFGPQTGCKPSFQDLSKSKLNYGHIENNFVFNFLDYVLWRDAKAANPALHAKFTFTFRSSVEHFYPQHPMDGQEQLEDKFLHDFGNLCLISHSKNAKLSNYLPSAKQEHFQRAMDGGEIDSLKLHCMLTLRMETGSWGEEEIALHSKTMRHVFTQELQQFDPKCLLVTHT